MLLSYSINEVSDVPQLISHADGLLKLMSVLTNDKRYMEVYSTDLDKMEGLDMCEVLDRVESRGENKYRSALV